MLPRVRKEILTVRKFHHLEGKKKEMEIVRKREGNCEESKELKRNSRNKLQMIVLTSEKFWWGGTDSCDGGAKIVLTGH